MLAVAVAVASLAAASLAVVMAAARVTSVAGAAMPLVQEPEVQRLAQGA